MRASAAGALASALLLWGASACTRTTSARGLAYGSADDVALILRSGGVARSGLQCNNPSYDGAITRGVTCALTLSPAEIASLTAKIPLAPGSPNPNGNRDTCEAMPGLASTLPGVAVLIGKNTKVTNGVGPVEVHVASATGAACIQITYPWSE